MQISNFLGFALECTERVLRELGHRLPILWVLGHPGKIAKTLDGVWDTHSRKSGMAMGAVARVAAQCGFNAEVILAIERCNTVEAILQLLHGQPWAPALWSEIEHRAARLMHEKVPQADRVEVRLFALDARPLGQAA